MQATDDEADIEWFEMGDRRDTSREDPTSESYKSKLAPENDFTDIAPSVSLLDVWRNYSTWGMSACDQAIRNAHLDMLRHFLETDEKGDSVLILDQDVDWVYDLRKCAATWDFLQSDAAKHAFDLVMLGHCPFPNLFSSGHKGVPYSWWIGHGLVRLHSSLGGGVAYIVSRQGAKQLLRLASEHPQRPWDDIPNADPSLRVWAIFPMICMPRFAPPLFQRIRHALPCSYVTLCRILEWLQLLLPAIALVIVASILIMIVMPRMISLFRRTFFFQKGRVDAIVLG